VIYEVGFVSVIAFSFNVRLEIKMVMDQKMVVHLLDGTVLKGRSHDFNLNKEMFHLDPEGIANSGKTIEIHHEFLKAAFFVKDFSGNRYFEEIKDFEKAPKKNSGKKAIITFSDGEVLAGFVEGYKESRPGFILVPIDPGSNNLKIFVNKKGLKNIEFP